ncbi:MAG: pitrilysin family protein [Myxococcota bacterium]
MPWNLPTQLLLAASLGVAAPATDATPAAAPAADGVTTQTGSALGVDLTVKSFTLDNGLKVYVVEDHSVPSFSMHTAYAVGSQDEEQGRSGFAHLFEHMMFKGSENVPDGGYFKYVLGAGGTMNAFTTADVTQYFAILPSNYLDMMLWLESDRLRSLVVTDENFENQRSAVKEERAMRYENAAYAGAILDFYSEIWTGTGYGHSTIGTQEDLNAASTEDVRAFFNKYYVPNNAVIAIVGDVDFADVKTKVESYYGNIAKGEPNTGRKNLQHKQKKISKRVEDPYARQPLYVLGWKTVAEDHPDRPALELLMSMLLRGESARITRVLTDEKKMVLAAVPMPTAGGRNAGTEMAGFIPLPGTSFADIQAAVKVELDTIKAKGVTTRDLIKAKNQATVGTVGQLATNNGRAFLIAQGALFDGDPLFVLKDLEAVQAVTAKDIKRVAQTYLTDEWITLEVVPKP